MNEVENNNAKNDSTQNEGNNLSINGINQPVNNTKKIQIIQQKKQILSSNSEAVEAIKSALKDKGWIRENIMVDIEYLKDTDQKLTLMCLKKESDGTPVIILYNFNDLVDTKAVLVSYDNGKVTTEVICEGAMRILEVDPNNRILKVSDSHMGVTGYAYSKVVNKKISFVEWFEEPYIEEPGVGYFHSNGNNESEEISKEEYESLIKKYENYNFVSIDTELTNENIDKCIK